MALGMNIQRTGDSSNKHMTINAPAYVVPLSSLFVVLPQFFGFKASMHGKALDSRREQIAGTFRLFTWEQLVEQACEVYEAKNRTLRNVDSLEDFLAEFALIEPYHAAARHAVSRR